MRIGFGILAAWFLATCAAEASIQQPSPPDETKATRVLALKGCISATPDVRRTITMADTTQGETYRLTGTDVRGYVGQHVEILGTRSKRLRIVGGLYPSPNVAAQAGAIDPTQAAIASQSAPANVSNSLVEFRVKSVRVTPGVCPDR